MVQCSITISIPHQSPTITVEHGPLVAMGALQVHYYYYRYRKKRVKMAKGGS